MCTDQNKNWQSRNPNDYWCLERCVTLFERFNSQFIDETKQFLKYYHWMGINQNVVLSVDAGVFWNVLWFFLSVSSILLLLPLFVILLPLFRSFVLDAVFFILCLNIEWIIKCYRQSITTTSVYEEHTHATCEFGWGMRSAYKASTHRETDNFK